MYWRTPSYTLARCFLTLCVAFIYGSMYFRQAYLPRPYASMGNVQNIMGIMFSSTNFLGMTNLVAVMPLVGECPVVAVLALEARCSSRVGCMVQQ